MWVHTHMSWDAEAVRTVRLPARLEARDVDARTRATLCSGGRLTRKRLEEFDETIAAHLQLRDKHRRPSEEVDCRLCPVEPVIYMYHEFQHSRHPL